jgi:hypothetical protein
MARDLGYLTNEAHAKLIGATEEIGRMLGAMLREPEKFS